MTGRPDHTPDNPPERITDWASWSEAQARALHGVTLGHAPTLDALLDRYIQVTDELAGLNKYFTQRLAEVKADRDAAVADATRLRERATLTDAEQRVVNGAQRYVNFETSDIYPTRASMRELLAIVSRLTTHDTAPDGETR